MTPLKPVTPGARIALGVAFFVLFFAAWAAATFGGFVSPTFLAETRGAPRDELLRILARRCLELAPLPELPLHHEEPSRPS